MVWKQQSNVGGQCQSIPCANQFQLKITRSAIYPTYDKHCSRQEIVVSRYYRIRSSDFRTHRLVTNRKKTFFFIFAMKYQQTSTKFFRFYSRFSHLCFALGSKLASLVFEWGLALGFRPAFLKGIYIYPGGRLKFWHSELGYTRGG